MGSSWHSDPQVSHLESSLTFSVWRWQGTQQMGTPTGGVPMKGITGKGGTESGGVLGG